ncbi:helix-turn-helix domain-containing protein [Azospirillum sp. BE72]|uniref:helix-turn-helix domain-containing protein n=1 Tax=Azospirillum sp. BE72 TaxID=2817776 RepID=UPI0028640AF2|nr:helix-turn-helix domain-containing protein [Azospirillum sp. BE72]MDR6773312.1 transcriptional regulator with XRE-family HTH domain [Azospirillum sp. BE72]
MERLGGDGCITPERCRFFRRQLGWSQEALAEKATLSVSAVRSFELGKGSSQGYVPGSLRRASEAAGVRMDSDEASRTATVD